MEAMETLPHISLNNLIDAYNILLKLEEDVKPATFEDYKYACLVAKEISDWWKSDDMEKFFESFQDFWNDDESGASESYKKKLDTYRARLKTKLSDGNNNHYYYMLDNWFNCIVDQIDDFFQNPCRLDLTDPDGMDMKSYYVDPEIG